MAEHAQIIKEIVQEIVQPKIKFVLLTLMPSQAQVKFSCLYNKQHVS